MSVAKNSTSAAIVARISSTTAGPNVLHALSLPSAFSYQGSVSATIRQTAPAAASSSPRRSEIGGISERLQASQAHWIPACTRAACSVFTSR